MIIALMGRAKSGKDTIGEMIHEALPAQVVRLAFADKLKQVCVDLFGLSRDDVYTEAGKDHMSRFPGWTNRAILQHIATEMRRVDNNVFVNVTMREAARVLAKYVRLTHDAPVTKMASIVVITDCRFRVEADAVWLAGGQVWRIRRPLTDGQQQGIAGHVSETEMDSIPEELFQRVIVNDGTLEHLRAKVMSALAT